MSLKGLQKRLRVDGSHIWYIDKRVRRYGRLCESTGTADREEAERYLLRRLQELREVLIYGERLIRTFGEAVQCLAQTAMVGSRYARGSQVVDCPHSLTFVNNGRAAVATPN